jgi:predicted amidohydrolase YtcJ
MLAAGKLADLVVIDHDLFEIPPEEIRNAKVLTTVVGGKVVSGGWPAAASL